MNKVAIEALWLRLQTGLAAFAENVCFVDPTLVHGLTRTKNDTFLLRVYLTFCKQTQGDEVAINVDIRRINQELIIESDVCMDDGTIIAVGPSITVPLSNSESHFGTAIDCWLCEFDEFLKESELAVLKVAAQLT